MQGIPQTHINKKSLIIHYQVQMTIAKTKTLPEESRLQMECHHYPVQVTIAKTKGLPERGEHINKRVCPVVHYNVDGLLGLQLSFCSKEGYLCMYVCMHACMQEGEEEWRGRLGFGSGWLQSKNRPPLPL